MKAKEMFEELGYKLEKKSEYAKDMTTFYKCDDFGEHTIEFCSSNRTFKIFDFRYELIKKDITVEELQAIYKQCKELRWIK